MIVLHRGKCGDLIALCAWLKERHSQQRVRIYIKEHRSFHPYNVGWIRPLLLQQPYIQKIEMCDKLSDVEPVLDVPCDLQLARKEALQKHSYTGWWVDEQSWWDQLGIVRNQTDLRDRFALAYQEPIKGDQPWLQLPQAKISMPRPYIVVSVTPRYRCMYDVSAVRELADDYDILFLGDQNNWRYLAPYCKYAKVANSIVMAQVIRDAALFVGTQTLQAWIAQSLGVDRIVSTSTKFHDTTLRVEKGFKAAIQTPQELKGALQKWKRAS